VPYALHANTADSIIGGASGPHTIDTDTQLDSAGVTALGFVAGAHTIDTDTQLDSAGVTALGFVAGAHTIETDPIFGASLASGITGADTTYWNTDNDTTNELQNININNDSLSLSNANTVSLKPYKQELSVSLTGDTLHLQNGGFVIIPGISAANNIGTYPAGTVHCTVTPTAVIGVTNPTTGETWMDRNLGATQVATSSTDANSYGDLYQWGRRSDGHQCRTSSTTTTLSSIDQPANGNFILGPSAPYDWRSPQNTNLWQGVNGVNNPCPKGYRVPTETELNAERLSWNANNGNGAFASPLKLPRAGGRLNNGSLVGGGHYWSSTVSGNGSRSFRYDNSAAMYNDLRAKGYSVRCIKD
ncbi:fibrobacter succinogenes major paralogous domain-containing protein, partial [Salibacteraceae bacterium]|nr:fibrobacter succinogenes major paralogous domain-containing protein [Salibacteraceae bacterium]